MSDTKVISIINNILDDLSLAEYSGEAGYIVGGAAVDLLAEREPRDFDVVIFHEEDKDGLIHILALQGRDFDLFETYGASEESRDRLNWVIKTNIDGCSVDFISWVGVHSLHKCLSSFDFDVNQAWIDEYGDPQCTPAFVKAHTNKVATFNPSHEGTTEYRMSRMQDKFPGYEFKDVRYGDSTKKAEDKE